MIPEKNKFKMNVKLRDGLILLTLALICLGFWIRLEYPHLSVINLSIDKQKAYALAEEYLQGYGIVSDKYSKAIIFGSDKNIDRYLQHALGQEAEEEFLAAHDCDLFFWKVRFFKELQKEEYIVYISPRNGKVLGFRHLIDDVQARTDLGKDSAKQLAREYLQKEAGIHLGDFDFHHEEIKRFENRTEYLFSWEKKGVYLPWKEGQGGAKLLIGATVSGNEVREFYKNELELPDGFLRYMENQFLLGTYIYSIYFCLFLILLAFAVYTVLRRRFAVAVTIVKKWYYYVAAFLVVINIAGLLNNFQSIIMSYPSSVAMSSFLGLYFATTLLSIGFLAFGFLLPGVAGESLCIEALPGNKYCGFLHYIKSSFLNRNLTYSIILGYVIWIIMLGVQALVFFYGQRFLGVWREWYGLSQFSSSFFPLWGAFVLAITASFSEEIIFRLFGITLLKKYLQNTVLAVLLAALVWGLGHTTYAIFPVWFRVLEIGIIGLIYGFIFLRFGLVVLIVAHYLFDVFWSSAAYIFGTATPSLFFTSLGLLFMPLGLAVIAYFLNMKDNEKEIRISLNKAQRYNLEILVSFILLKKAKGINAGAIREELLDNGWDYILVDLAIKQVF